MMSINDKMKKQIKQLIDKHQRNSIFLNEMATIVRKELNALMVEEMSLQSLIKIQEEASSSRSPQNENTATEKENPDVKTDSSNPVCDSLVGYEELDLQILSYGNLKTQDGTAQDDEEDSDKTEDDDWIEEDDAESELEFAMSDTELQPQ